MLKVLDFVDAMPVIEHRAAYDDGRAHALADDPLLVLVFARDGIALVVDGGGEAGGPIGATPAVDAGALEKFSAQLHQVVGYGPARGAQASAHLQREARELHGVTGDIAFVERRPSLQSFPASRLGCHSSS